MRSFCRTEADIHLSKCPSKHRCINIPTFHRKASFGFSKGQRGSSLCSYSLLGPCKPEDKESWTCYGQMLPSLQLCVATYLYSYIMVIYPGVTATPMTTMLPNVISLWLFNGLYFTRQCHRLYLRDKRYVLLFSFHRWRNRHREFESPAQRCTPLASGIVRA